MTQRFSHFTPADFDKYDCVKLSRGIYLLLAFVLRGYLVWMMSVTNMNDRVSIIRWIYPEPKYFYLSLLSGALGLFVILIISLRRPDAAKWVRVFWQRIRIVMVISLLFDLVITVLGLVYWQLSVQWLLINVAAVAIFVTYLYRSKRLALNIDEFPEKLPED